MANKIQFQPIAPMRQPKVADQVYEMLHEQILSLKLKPGSKLSEVEVAKQMGVSRQPVREAFSRLSNLGFLLIRPQRATIVRTIAEDDVLQAMFIRAALEFEVIRMASKTLNSSQIDQLSEVLDKQEITVAEENNAQFHILDDLFHRTICEFTGADFVWARIQEQKGHMDRMRILTLAFGAQTALNEHRQILDALRDQNSELAIEHMREHLSRIKSDLPRIRAKYAQYFAKETE